MKRVERFLAGTKVRSKIHGNDRSDINISLRAASFLLSSNADNKAEDL
jgi:hypothetical protein